MLSSSDGARGETGDYVLSRFENGTEPVTSVRANFMVEIGRKYGAHPKFSGSGGGIVGTFPGEEAFAGMAAELKELNCEVSVHKYFLTMGAIGAAILAREHISDTAGKTSFKGLGVSEVKFTPKAFNCADCPNHCEITYVEQEGANIIARWGSRCGKWTI